jgi:hypothetical protein
METKECKVCHTIKPINEFHKHPQYADGHDSTCSACRNEQRKKRRQNQKNERPVNLHPKIHPVYSNPELAKFTPRQLIEELKSRGYSGELLYVQKIKL